MQEELHLQTFEMDRPDENNISPPERGGGGIITCNFVIPHNKTDKSLLPWVV